LAQATTAEEMTIHRHQEQTQRNLTLEELEIAASKSPRDVALLRIRWLLEDEEGDDDDDEEASENRDVGSLPAFVVGLLRGLLGNFFDAYRNRNKGDSDSCWREHHSALLRLLKVHLLLSARDPVLGEEIGRHGSHALLSKKLIAADAAAGPEECVVYSCDDDDDDNGQQQQHQRPQEEQELRDALMELQDAACEIASTCGGNFPERASPFSREELKRRLPLRFDVGCSVNDGAGAAADNSVSNKYGTASAATIAAMPSTILINQIWSRQSAQEDVGFGESSRLWFLGLPLSIRCRCR